jgi:hypothetical protein
VSNIWCAQVNQKLYFAQLLLNDAREQTGAMQTALLEAVAFQAITAYRFYLKEIVQYQRRNTDADDARSARRQLAGQGFVCQELEELARLEEDNLWPAQLLSVYRRITGREIAGREITGREKIDATTTSARSAVPASQSIDAIPVADITETASANSYQQWLDQFRSVIDIHRNMAQEW